MNLQWKEFRIHLESLNTYLKQNVLNADGIVADENGYKIVEAQPFTLEEKHIITDYLDSLTESGELEKFNGAGNI